MMRIENTFRVDYAASLRSYVGGCAGWITDTSAAKRYVGGMVGWIYE